MFERYLTDALAQHFGHVLENVDADQIRISAWKGNVVLRDLTLRPSLHFGGGNRSNNNGDDGSFLIQHGTIGVLEFSIPWKLLLALFHNYNNNNNNINNNGDPQDSSMPDQQQQQQQQQMQQPTSCSIVLSDVQVLVTPSSPPQPTNSGDDDHDDAKNRKENRSSTSSMSREERERLVQSCLDKLLFQSMRKQATNHTTASCSSSPTTTDPETTPAKQQTKHHWIQSWISQMLETLTVTVKNIHVRYEDDGCCRSHHGMSHGLVPKNDSYSKHASSQQSQSQQPQRPPFAVGLRLTEFTIQTTDRGPPPHDNTDDDSQQQQSPQEWIERHKLAAARDLSIYWDSGTTLLTSSYQSLIQETKSSSPRPLPVLPINSPAHLDNHDVEEDERRFEQDPSLSDHTNIDKDDALLHHPSSLSDHDKNEKEEYYARMFQNLSHHTYILAPVSPSLHLTLVTAREPEQVAAQDQTDHDDVPEDEMNAPQQQQPHPQEELNELLDSPQQNMNHNTTSMSRIPPSRAQLDFPVCQFSLARDTLEDIVYLRRSVAVREDRNTGMASHALLQQLAQLRPHRTSVRTHARIWWHYAVQATILLIHSNDDNHHYDTTTSRTNPNHHRTPCNWVRLARALARRKRYTCLYHELIAIHHAQQQDTQRTGEDESWNSKSHSTQDTIHAALLKMEQHLEPNEIVAFRIHAQNTRSTKTSSNHAGTLERPTTSSTAHPAQLGSEAGGNRWQGWLPGWNQAQPNGEGDSGDVEEGALPLDGNDTTSNSATTGILSCAHRIQMFEEMAAALVEGRIVLSPGSGNGGPVEDNSTSPGHSAADTLPLPLDPYAVTWQLAFVCPILSVQVSDRPTLSLSHPRAVALNETNNDESSTLLRGGRPIARLSCASIQRFQLQRNGTWELDCSLASLEVVDLMTTKHQGHVMTMTMDNPTNHLVIVPEHTPTLTLPLGFPRLLTRKSSKASNLSTLEEGTTYIGGIPHSNCVSISIRKESHVNQGGFSSNEKDDIDGLSTTTYTNIRVYPMEAVYSTGPLEALSRTFAAAKSPELASDYRRAAVLVSKWKTNQKQKLMHVLAERRRNVVINVDVAAPVLYVPEDVKASVCPELVIDLGRLTFHNATDSDVSSASKDAPTLSDYDDKWKLALADVQVSCSSTSSAREFCHLIEPFSLDFVIHTKVVDNEAHSVEEYYEQTRVHMTATLPRLVFNLTSSAVRLVSRLQEQWDKTRRRARSALTSNPTTFRPHTTSGQRDEAALSQTSSTASVGAGSVVEFHFSAPLIALRLENDVDGRDCVLQPQSGEGPYSSIPSSTPIVNLTMQGIRGKVVSTTTGDGSETKFSAKLRSLHAVDAYQRAGHDYALLLSSIPPDLFYDKYKQKRKSGENSVNAGYEGFVKGNDLAISWADDLTEQVQTHKFDELSESDLVIVDYVKKSAQKDPECDPEEAQFETRISIGFHELYVEWNPESIAAIQKAVRLPRSELNPSSNRDEEKHISKGDADDDSVSLNEFFDAVEDSECGVLEVMTPDRSSGTNYLSEASSTSSVASDFDEDFDNEFYDAGTSTSHFPTSLLFQRPSGKGMAPISITSGLAGIPEDKKENKEYSKRKVQYFECTFQLSKLRVRLNKESRHRRLVIAEMDRTHLSYTRKPFGGISMTADIGNLTFTDPGSLGSGKTLYGQIIGLKSDVVGASLVNFVFETFPRDSIAINETGNSTSQSIDDATDARKVSIDAAGDKIVGCDYFLQLRFSPMRFVYLQQYWMEVFDYIFEGILGNEVWGRPPPQVASYNNHSPDDPRGNDESESPYDGVTKLFGSDGVGFSFCRFDIKMESPVLIVPVSYLSPQHIRFGFEGFSISNFYKGTVERGTGPGLNPVIAKQLARGQNIRVQWYNNMRVAGVGLKLLSWCGRELSSDSEVTANSESSLGIGVNLTATWPVGPAAPLVMPKWNVTCGFDSLYIALRRPDYALFQHVIFNNIGEPSRHIDEWNALQNLPPSELQKYKENIMVHFGYDKKDGPSSTFNLVFSFPSICIHFLSDERDDAVLRDCGIDLANVNCSGVKYTIRKLSDLIFHQSVSCRTITLAQTTNKSEWSGFKELLLPLKADPAFTSFLDAPSSDQEDTSEVEYEESHHKEERAPQMIYSSTSAPNRDTVKYLEINEGCIYLVFPAWMYLKAFFRNLPEPQFFTPHEAINSLQIGDRFYSMQSSAPSERDSTHHETNQTSHDSSPIRDNSGSYVPSYQFRLLLVEPRIVIVDDHSRSDTDSAPCRSVTLHLSHLDYLSNLDNSKGLDLKSFFVHDLRLYTSSNRQDLNLRDNFFADNSLIHPWSLCGSLRNSSIEGEEYDRERKFSFFSEVLRARAAYSDMSRAIDVGLKTISDFQSVKSVAGETPGGGGNESTSIKSSMDNSSSQDVSSSKKTSLNVWCEGFDLLVIDDSNRHFAQAQELIALSLGGIQFLRDEQFEHEDPVSIHVGTETDHSSIVNGSNRIRLKRSTMDLRLNRLKLYDCLQPQNSPFKITASSSEADVFPVRKTREGLPPDSDINNVPSHDTQQRIVELSWEEYSMIHASEWGFSESQMFIQKCAATSGSKMDLQASNESNVVDLIEVQVITLEDRWNECNVKFRTLAVQWNPSTVIALQRFLGRLTKEANTKMSPVQEDILLAISQSESNLESDLGYLKDWAAPDHEALDDSIQKKATDRKRRKQLPLRANILVHRFMVCLNKEHQNRRLIEATLSGSHVLFEKDMRGIRVCGSVEDLVAWDADERCSSERNGSEMNRKILSVVRDTRTDDENGESKKLVKFHYRTFSKEQYNVLHCKHRSYSDEEVAASSSYASAEVPEWIDQLIPLDSLSSSPQHSIDDFLVASVASTRFVYLRERTEEIVDYLSNGLPGKGMGATSRAAKGFFNKRIKTRSFLDLAVDSPQIYVPQNHTLDRGITFRLGDVGIKSWFEEGTMKEKESLSCDTAVGEMMPLSAMLSATVKGTVHPGVETMHKSPKVNDASHRKDWWRVLSVSSIGLGWHTSTNVAHSKKPVDLHLTLRKPSWYEKTIIVRGKMSNVDFVLTYLDYALLRAVLRDNVGKTVNMAAWDNVEKAYSTEASEDDNVSASKNDAFVRSAALGHSRTEVLSKVVYAADARFVRYGTMAKSQKKHFRVGSDTPSLVHEGGDFPGVATTNQAGVDSENIENSENNKKAAIDFKFELDGLKLKLHRNDELDELNIETRPALNYDMILLKVKRIEASISTNSAGGKSFHLSLYRIGVFDIGDIGRLTRERYYQEVARLEERGKEAKRTLRNPSAFSILAEGYRPSEDDDQHMTASARRLHAADPQVVITVDTRGESSTETVDSMSESQHNEKSKVTVARVVVNYLSLNALVRPIMETAAFISCKWRAPVLEHQPEANEVIKPHSEENAAGTPSDDQLSETGSLPSQPENGRLYAASKEVKNLPNNSGFQIKVVAHYPRVFLVADESDPYSRALVLRGLAVVNAKIMKEGTPRLTKKSDVGTNPELRQDGSPDYRTMTSLDAHFHSMETYINPNVDSALGPNRRQADSLFQNENDGRYESSSDSESQIHGVALIEPVTAAFEFCQIERSRFPTSRRVFLSIEPVSTTISFEDLSLIQSVLRRWSYEKKNATIDVVESQSEDWPDSAPSSPIKSRDRQFFKPNIGNRDPLSTSSPSPLGSSQGQRILGAEFISENGASKRHCTSNLSISDFSEFNQSVREKPQVKASHRLFDITFHGPRLGLGLLIDGNDIVVKSIQNSEVEGTIEVGDVLVSVNGEAMKGNTLQQVVRVLSTALGSGPVRVLFSRKYFDTFQLDPTNTAIQPFEEKASSDNSSISGAGSQEEDEIDPTQMYWVGSGDSDLVILARDQSSVLSHGNSVVPYTVVFAKGLQNGLTLERSPCGDIAVVSAIDSSLYLLSLESSSSMDQSQGTTKVRTGAVVLAVNEYPSTDIGYSGTTAFLHKVTSVPNEETGSNHEKEATYCVTFLEADSTDWGYIDSAEVTIAGVNLTFIDDFKGRDMPVVRGNLKSIRINCERGLGLKTRLIDVPPPSLISIGPLQGSRNEINESHISNDKVSDGNNAKTHSADTNAMDTTSIGALPRVSDLSETIMNFKAQVGIGIEYYHPRVALWEPLLEPCHLGVLLERQSGNVVTRIPRSGNLAIEFSDNLADRWSKKREDSAQLVNINITSAAAEMIIRTMAEWKEWRKGPQSSIILDASKSSGIRTESPEIDVPLRTIQTPGTNVLKGHSIIEQSSNKVSPQEVDFKQNDPNATKGLNYNTHLSLPSEEFPTQKRDKSLAAARRAAAQNAAQAALMFAQKRGAATQKTEPGGYILRNRTGCSLSFVQQLSCMREAHSEHQHDERHFQSDVNVNNEFMQKSQILKDRNPQGLYHGISKDAGSSTVVQDGQEARFKMEMIFDEFSTIGRSMSDVSKGTNRSKRVTRTYDGDFPHLTVALKSSTGILLDPICDLPVVKVGRTVRLLKVYNTEGVSRAPSKDTSQKYTEEPFVLIPIIWAVEIDNNRRILTISSAISITPLGCGVPLEIGVKQYYRNKQNCNTTHPMDLDDEESDEESLSPISTIGKSSPDQPFYLPVWLGMNCEKVEVFTRPSVHSSDSEFSSLYLWSQNCILELQSMTHGTDAHFEDTTLSRVETWSWTADTSSKCVYCPPTGDAFGKDYLLPFIMCCTVAREDLDDLHHKIHQLPLLSNLKSKGNLVPIHHKEISLCITIDSSLSIRNMLPTALQWEVAEFEEDVSILDGSSLRRRQLGRYGYMPGETRRDVISGNQACALDPGRCADVFACDVSAMMIRARFRCSSREQWSSWAHISSAESRNFTEEGDETSISGHNTPKKRGNDNEHDLAQVRPTRQLNVQVRDEFGVPLTIGVKIVPKASAFPDMLEVDGGLSYGMEVIVYAELWVRNLTLLPLAFGCPSAQIHTRKKGDIGEGESSSVAAEAALMEIASVLELGDRGKSLLNAFDQNLYLGGDTYMLPLQQCDSIIEEVFEYIEIESSTIKRRWWASEKHDSTRQPPSDDVPGGSGWQWFDNNGWKIDCSGQATEGTGGWESCRNLVGGRENTFSPRRLFNPVHPFRRRRWYRTRVRTILAEFGVKRVTYEDEDGVGIPSREIAVFHQPVLDAATRAQKEAERNAVGVIDNSGNEGGKFENNKDRQGAMSGYFDLASSCADDGSLRISVKCADGHWSLPAIIPPSGGGHGVIRLPASRWPLLTRTSNANKMEPSTDKSYSENIDCFGIGELNPALYELCYHVSLVSGGLWGESSRLLAFAPRFFLRNDSIRYNLEVKQVGAPDASAVELKPGGSVPFYWSDVRLPELVCVRPVVHGSYSSIRYPGAKRRGISFYRWSGGFDIAGLGMAAIRIRQNRQSYRTTTPIKLQAGRNVEDFQLRSIRALVEIRPKTGSTGMIVSFKEENSLGVGSLFRIENFSPFPLWIAQDGVLANPHSMENGIQKSSHVVADVSSAFISGVSQDGREMQADAQTHGELNGDLIMPMKTISFGLDVPFRQGKYTHRMPANMVELLRVRVGLAPLSTREGIESTKVVGLTTVGETVRLSPSKLIYSLDEAVVTNILGVRVLGVICTDGPTRVLRFCMMQKAISTSGVIGNAVRMRSMQGDSYLEKMKSAAPQSSSPVIEPYNSEVKNMTARVATKIADYVTRERLPTESEAKNQAFRGHLSYESTADFFETEYGMSSDNRSSLSEFGDLAENSSPDQFFSVRASLTGFLFSVVDSVPSEIAVVSFRSVDILAKWNSLRTADISVVLTIGGLQVDNHCPAAPFPVALCPAESSELSGASETNPPSDTQQDMSKIPLISIVMNVAPRHKSGITCLREVTVASRDLIVAIDLAFIMRIQRFLLSVQELYERSMMTSNVSGIDTDSIMPFSEFKESNFPDLSKLFQSFDGAAVAGVSNQNHYFKALTLLPFHINLSVAPARALTTTQAIFEGHEAAAIHAAVRKGDLLIGDGAGGLGVKVGSKNRTALAVVRGVFKSILVDALLRCDGASLSFSGVGVRNHISTMPQVLTYLGAHYLDSLRSNVPALLGSLAAFGNPIGLIRGLGDGVSDFVSEPVKGLKRSVKELDPSFVVDGVARGTESLARHTLGGFADSASLLTETFSKNMAVLTLDRKYAQRRDRRAALRVAEGGTATFVEGVESGVVKLIRGIVEGVTGVVRAPIRGAEKRGVEGFAKGVGKGLLGLLVKPVIGLSDAATDVMIGVKGSVEGGYQSGIQRSQVRPRRALYGRDRAIRAYQLEDATAASLFMSTRLAGENYLSHLDMGDKVALLSVKRLLLLGEDGEERLVVRYRQIKELEVRDVLQENGDMEYGVIVFLNSPRTNGSEVEVIGCKEKKVALELCEQVKRGINLVDSDM